MNSGQPTAEFFGLGEYFPELEVETTIGKVSLPSHFDGNWFVLFSYPKDFTPICTAEAVAFAKRLGEFREKKCEIIGLSIDDVSAHKEWIKQLSDKLDFEFNYPLISDASFSVSQKLGLMQPQNMGVTSRAVYIVDKSAKIRTILFYPQEINRNIDEILRIIGELQKSDAKV